MIDLELFKRVRDSLAPKSAITQEMFSEFIEAIEDVKHLMWLYQNHVDREKWIEICYRRDKWLEKYFGELK